MIKILKYIPLAATILFVLFWIGFMAKCQLLTIMYAKEFTIPDEVIEWAQEGGRLKVLEYNDQSARIYYIQNNAGFKIDFIKYNDAWILETWGVLWAKSGSAEAFIWPYFYHSAEGRAISFVIGVPIVLISVWVACLGRKPKIKRTFSKG